MNIQTVANNLRATIAGKEKLLASYQERLRHYDELDDQGDGWFAVTTAIPFIEINLDELKRILQDVEQCIEKVEV